MKNIAILIMVVFMTFGLKAQEIRMFSHISPGKKTVEYPANKMDSITFATLPIPDDNTGVVINGVEWAPFNVDLPGTFTKSPTDAGWFYQWGSNLGWSSTSPLMASDSSSTWIIVAETGNEWKSEKNPCPTGWRLPTKDEMQSLVNAGSRWCTWNNVNGRILGTGAKNIFLPAPGFRINTTGVLNYKGAEGDYWTGDPCGADNAYSLEFGAAATVINVKNYKRANGFSVRCVKE